MKDLKKRICSILNNKDSHILVVGDLMLDRYFHGTVNRISPEAPVPIISICKKKSTLGGAANVALNIAKMGSLVSLIGAIGDDHNGRILEKKMDEFSFDRKGIVKCRNTTTTKIRIVGSHQQMLRMDFEEVDNLEKLDENILLENVCNALDDSVDVVVVSDYHKGVCSEEVCKKIIDVAHKRGIPVLVDPKGDEWGKYSYADYITPNVKEICDVMGRNILNEIDDLKKAADNIKEKFNIDNVICTRSEKGMTLFLKNEQIDMPTDSREVYDVSGAGDTVIAAIAISLANKTDMNVAAEFANIAAGISVGKLGTYAVTKEDILKKLNMLDV